VLTAHAKNLMVDKEHSLCQDSFEGIHPNWTQAVGYEVAVAQRSGMLMRSTPWTRADVGAHTMVDERSPCQVSLEGLHPG
jgi:hypothetical protein